MLLFHVSFLKKNVVSFYYGAVTSVCISCGQDPQIQVCFPEILFWEKELELIIYEVRGESHPENSPGLYLLCY
jgi:hypothetical protein